MQKRVVLLTACCTLIVFSSAALATITKPYTFSNGATADANQVNANFNTVYQQTNVNTANIATAINSITARKVNVSSPYNSSNFVASQALTAICGTGEVLTGGSCSCTHSSMNTATTNYGLVWGCETIGNSIVGMCGTNAITYSQTKYGPPITITAVCASITVVGGAAKNVANAVDNEAVDLNKAEREAVVQRMEKEQLEFLHLLQQNKVQ